MNSAVSVTSLARYVTSGVRRAILILMAAVGCVLLIGCVNAANLLLARSGERRHELAIRSALGATRLRILRQVLIQSGMLGAAGGLAGLVLGSGDGRHLRDALVIAEVALCTVLLASAALFLRSLKRLNAVDPGFRAEV